MTTRIKLTTNPHYEKSGTKSYLYAMRKFRFNPTKGGPYFFGNTMVQSGRPFTNKPVGGRARLKRVLQKNIPGTDQAEQVSAEDVQNDCMYLAEVGVGTPAQKLRLSFDTGSTNLWVWSTELPSKILSEHKSHAVFDPTKSSTYKEKEESAWRISHEDGSLAYGTLGNDHLSIGSLVVKGQDIEIAERLSAQFVQNTGDGVLGLAFGSINSVDTDPVNTLVENMITQSDIPKLAKLFTAKLGSRSGSDEPDEDQPFFTFGHIDQDTVRAAGAEISYTSIDNSQGVWMFDSASATVNGKLLTRSGNKAIADTGIALTLVGDETCQAVYDAIEGAVYDDECQGWIYPSDTVVDKLPVVSLAVGDQRFVVQKEDLGFAEAKPGYVYGAIQSRGSMTMDVLGVTFLRAIYAIFDVGNLRFGALQRKELNHSLSL